MKTILLLLLSTTALFAQNKFSIGPTYWFNYGEYSYQLRSAYDGSTRDFSGYSTGSSIGLVVHYHLSPRWNVSVGGLYNNSVSHVKAPGQDYARLPAQEEFAFPVLINYRLSNRRLAPYFSAGAIFAKDRLFGDVPLRSIRANALLGIGVDYKLNDRLSWLIQPTASYLLSKPEYSQIIFEFASYNSYKIGIQTQLLIHF